MSILSSTGKILMVREPICGRFGIHKLMAMLSSGALNVKWNGLEEISVVTFNRRRSICKILHADEDGVDCTTRILNTGLFQIIFEDNALPVHLTRTELEELLRKGSTKTHNNHLSAA